MTADCGEFHPLSGLRVVENRNLTHRRLLELIPVAIPNQVGEPVRAAQEWHIVPRGIPEDVKHLVGIGVQLRLRGEGVASDIDRHPHGLYRATSAASPVTVHERRKSGAGLMRDDASGVDYSCRSLIHCAPSVVTLATLIFIKPTVPVTNGRTPYCFSV